MPHTIEPASSGRAKCRGCGCAIAKGELRFGERMENPYGEGEMTLWFHLSCGALKRPEPFGQTLAAAELAAEAVERREWLQQEIERGLQRRRLPRVDGAQRAPSGRARCRSCREPIPKDSFRIGLVFYEEGRFEPSGYIHASCASQYLGTTDFVERAMHFSPDLPAEERQALVDAIA